MLDLSALRSGPLDKIALPASEAAAVTIAATSSRFVLRGAEDAAAAASTAFGVRLPERLNRAEGSSRAALMLGPDEWLLLAEGEDAVAIGDALTAAIGALPHSLVDISHRQVGLRIAGRSSILALQSGCPLDLRLAAFPIGMATRTLFHKAEIILWRNGEDRFHIEVWRSFAPFVVGHIEAARDAASDL
jgi:sarcosine oxidase subunit gamma